MAKQRITWMVAHFRSSQFKSVVDAENGGRVNGVKSTIGLAATAAGGRAAA